jgi:hypothetical protein
MTANTTWRDCPDCADFGTGLRRAGTGCTATSLGCVPVGSTRPIFPMTLMVETREIDAIALRENPVSVADLVTTGSTPSPQGEWAVRSSAC